MDCEKLRALLDAYIDGEISAEDARAMKEHAKTCEACAQEMEAAEMMRDALSHMDDDVVVPLEAQAAWRGAVRAEAKKRKKRKTLRLVYGAAAALVLVLGSTLMLNGSEDQLPLTVQPMATDNVIASDGAPMARSMDAAPAAYTMQEETYTARKKIEVAAPDAAIGTLQDLATEYSGSCAVEDDGMCRIEIPAAYLEDFLSAASHLGTELDSEILEAQAEQAIVYIQISESEAE